MLSSHDISGADRCLIIGTAGHIDHGKTRLVHRLTGINTDRLPEEKCRGISIDLGFAWFVAGGHRLGVVDVPGHERFVRNMVAGATGIDLALLVVAADDGVMPQTIEHLEIMHLLGVTAGCIAITKIDAVDAELVEFVQAELQERLRGTFLQDAPVVPVSAATGAGIAALLQALVTTADRFRRPVRPDLFRMPIDRVFTSAGHGTIVTGSVLGGSVGRGETLELLPAQRAVRVRTIQIHGRPADESNAGKRTAINLAGIKVDELQRGDEVAVPGYLKPARRLLVKLNTLSAAPVALRNRLSLMLHLGTCEVAARIIVPAASHAAGEAVYAELRTTRPVVAAWGQRFILRRPSPALTVAGGMVLDPGIAPRRRLSNISELAAARAAPDEAQRLAAFYAERNGLDLAPLEAAWSVGIVPEKFPALVESLKSSGLLVAIGSGSVIHAQRLAALSAAALKVVRTELRAHQPRRALPRSRIISACGRLGPPELVKAVLNALLRTGELVARGGNIGPADLQIQLTKNQALTRRRVLERIQAAGLMPPTLKELASELDQEPGAICFVQDVLVEEGELIRIEADLLYPPAALEQARRICYATIQALGSVTVSQLREAWGVSRRQAFPLCQYFDELQITVRDQDVRHAGPRIELPLTE